jgi:MFS transporter, PHS family, inorganic phosphate transporter
VWVVIVAGIGFLTDAYDIFALNVVIPMLGHIFWSQQGEVPQGVQTGMMCATLAGTMIGQIGFGIAADVLGRRKMYGLELIIVIVATVLLAMSSRGELDSMNVVGWLITWRAVMGLGIGADYPLSAVICSEFAPRRHRARMMSTLFFMQPVGQLLANVLSLGAVYAWKSQINQHDDTCVNDATCIRAIDRLWRLVVGIGAIPAVIALAFRFTIPESPRFKLDVQRKVNKVYRDMNDYYGNPVDPEIEAGTVLQSLQPKSYDHDQELRRTVSPPLPVLSAENMNHMQQIRPLSSNIAPDDIIQDDELADDSTAHHPADELRDDESEDGSGGPRPGEPPQASRADIKKFFIEEGNWQYLLGTSLSWLFLDFAFYGLGLSSPTIIRHIWNGGEPKIAVWQSLRDNSTHSLIMVSIGAVVGGAAMIKVIKHASPKVIQFWGFLVLAVLFIVTGSAWSALLNNGSQTGLIVLYILCQIVFNLGPNVTTFIVSKWHRTLTKAPG